MPPGADALAQARALLNTLRTLAAQHEMVLAAYERQLDIITAGGGPGAGGSKISKAPANKRPLLPGLPPGADLDGPEAKKGRVVAMQQARRNALWEECYRVLERCRRNSKAEAFKKPVDYVRMKIPDYPNVVKEPMDLQTVGEKLKLRVYKDPGEFAYDMRLIWTNAELYNGKVGGAPRAGAEGGSGCRRAKRAAEWAEVGRWAKVVGRWGTDSASRGQLGDGETWPARVQPWHTAVAGHSARSTGVVAGQSWRRSRPLGRARPR